MTESTMRERSLRTLQTAKRLYEEDPTEARTTWYGRVLGFRYQFDEAIRVFSEGLERFPDSYQLLRQRGHRYISTRRFDEALADLVRAAALIDGLPHWIEPDGEGNELPIPQTSIQFNVYYHLGLVRYLLRRWEDAVSAFVQCRDCVPENDFDGMTAAADWLYMTHRRNGDADAAEAVLAAVPVGLADSQFVEGPSYYRRLLMYRGELSPVDLLNPEKGEQVIHGLETIYATQGYGVGNWYLYNGHVDQAKAIFARILEGRSTSAFGYIAAELDMAELSAAAG